VHLGRVRELTGGRFFQGTVKLAEMELEEGRFEECLRLVQEVLNIDQSNGEAWELQAKVYMLRGQFDSAIQVFQKLYSVAAIARYAFDLGNALERKGDFAGARQVYLRGAQAAPTFIQGWQGLDRVAVKLGDRDMSETARRQIAELKSTGKWNYLTAMFFVTDKPKQIAP
jgi:tetratricopeptide (TPR) repeat protein